MQELLFNIPAPKPTGAAIGAGAGVVSEGQQGGVGESEGFATALADEIAGWGEGGEPGALEGVPTGEALPADGSNLPLAETLATDQQARLALLVRQSLGLEGGFAGMAASAASASRLSS